MARGCALSLPLSPSPSLARGCAASGLGYRMPWLPLLWCWEEEDPGAFEYVISLRHVVPCTTVVVPLPHPSLGLLNTSARGASAGFPLVMPSAAAASAPVPAPLSELLPPPGPAPAMGDCAVSLPAFLGHASRLDALKAHCFAQRSRGRTLESVLCRSGTQPRRFTSSNRRGLHQQYGRASNRAAILDWTCSFFIVSKYQPLRFLASIENLILATSAMLSARCALFLCVLLCRPWTWTTTGKSS